MKRNEELQDTLRDRFTKEALPHMDALFNFALHTCGDREYAGDLLQETYLRAFRSFRTFELGTNCKAWLFQILKNTFYTNYRRDQYVTSIRSDFPGAGNSVDLLDHTPAPPSEAAQIDRMFGDEVSEALESLPETYRTAVILSDIEGFRYDEIARYVGCPVGTVRSRLHRGRSMLAAALRTYGQSQGYGKSLLTEREYSFSSEGAEAAS